MTDLPRSERAERFRLTLDLFQSGVEMKRQSLLREFPDLTEEELDARLKAWLQDRPGAEHGDCSGKPGRWVPQTS
ncbi:MAG: hypothetical protein ACRD1X_15760 [Vicinamibacteria bacterium]